MSAIKLSPHQQYEEIRSSKNQRTIDYHATLLLRGFLEEHIVVRLPNPKWLRIWPYEQLKKNRKRKWFNKLFDKLREVNYSKYVRISRNDEFYRNIEHLDIYKQDLEWFGLSHAKQLKDILQLESISLLPEANS